MERENNMSGILNTVVTDIEAALLPLWSIVKDAVSAIETQAVGDLVNLIEAEVATIAASGVQVLTGTPPSVIVGNVLTTALNQGRKDLLAIDANVINGLTALKVQAAVNSAAPATSSAGS